MYFLLCLLISKDQVSWSLTDLVTRSYQFMIPVSSLVRCDIQLSWANWVNQCYLIQFLPPTGAHAYSRWNLGCLMLFQGSTLSPVGHLVSKFCVHWQNFYVPDKITNYFPSHNFALKIKWAIFGEMSKHLRSVVSTTFLIGWGWIHNKCFVLLNSTKMSNVLHWYASIWTKFLTNR